METVSVCFGLIINQDKDLRVNFIETHLNKNKDLFIKMLDDYENSNP